MWADAVFEGGGIKGIGLVGALSVAERKGFRWKKVAGSSAGSIIATLLAAGFTAEEMAELMFEKDFKDFLTPKWPEYLPYIGPAIRLWFKKGLYSGNDLEKWIAQILESKGIRTFKDLKGDTELHIIASDITRGQILVLPRDLEDYGYKLEDFPVAKVVRMSCSIPFFFDPVKLACQKTGEICYIVDGGVLSNFPVWLFDKEKPRWPTFGFRLYSPDEKQFHEISGPFSMLLSIFFTMLEAHDNRYIEDLDQVRSIQVPSLDVKLTDFSISEEKKKQLFQSGVQAAETFFNQWTFEDYLKARAKQKSIHSRLRKNSPGS
ncbi:MAG: patatin-like phospholipase family protein [Thermoactinomyces sp.]